MQYRMKFSEFILLTIFVSQITSKDITFHNVVIQACGEEDEITIAEGEKIKDFIPRNCLSIYIREQNVPILFEGSFGDLAMVRTLNMMNNSIREIRPGVFNGSSSIETVVLGLNKIEEVKAGVFNNLNIRTLSLAQNSISKIDSSAFDNMPFLDLINLGDNKISTWDSNWFRNSPKLDAISLSGNKIKYLPSRGFAGMLEIMEAESKNDEMGSPANWDPIRKVMFYVFVNNNQISSIEKDFFGGIYTNYFIFDNNSIECFEDSDFKVLTEHFNITSFAGNPMNCDCIDRLKEIGGQNNIYISDFNRAMETKCSNKTIN